MLVGLVSVRRLKRKKVAITHRVIATNTYARTGLRFDHDLGDCVRERSYESRRVF
jgi:hypothetical protein